MEQQENQEDELQTQPELTPELETIQQVAKTEAKLEEKLSHDYAPERLASTFQIIQKNLELMQQTVSLVVQRVDNLIKLHTDQTAQVLTLVENLESGISVVTDQAQAQEEALQRLATMIETLTTLEENLREDLAAEQEASS